MTESIFGKNLFEVYFDILVPHWGGRIYDLYCSLTPGVDQDALASLYCQISICTASGPYHQSILDHWTNQMCVAFHRSGIRLLKKAYGWIIVLYCQFKVFFTYITNSMVLQQSCVARWCWQVGEVVFPICTIHLRCSMTLCYTWAFYLFIYIKPCVMFVGQNALHFIWIVYRILKKLLWAVLRERCQRKRSGTIFPTHDSDSCLEALNHSC